MNNDKQWQEELDTFLAETYPSADTQFLARILSDEAQTAELARALHIEANLEQIGLQAMPTDLQETLQSITKQSNHANVVWLKFANNWKKLSGLAASVMVVGLVFTLQMPLSDNQTPTIAEIKQAEKDLKLALEYLSIAQAKSSIKVKQTLNEHVKAPFEESLLIPLDHLKES